MLNSILNSILLLETLNLNASLIAWFNDELRGNLTESECEVATSLPLNTYRFLMCVARANTCLASQLCDVHCMLSMFG